MAPPASVSIASSAMKFHGIAMVRNEADVIEIFVRHNLTVLDNLTVVDHGSVDATPSILAALASEGLPLEVTRETSLEFRQSDVVSREVRRILTTTGADFVFLLDADEFLKVPSRLRLEAALASMPSEMHAVQEWHTYVPDFTRPLDPVALIRSARKVVPASGGGRKAIVSRHFLDSPMLVVEGNHYLQKRLGTDGDPDVEHFPLSPEESALAHVPIRSAAQFSAKVAVRWLACLMQPDRLHQLLSYQWRKAYGDLLAGAAVTPDLLAGTALTPEKLTQLAVTCGLPEAEQVVERFHLVDEPFLADVKIAYPARANPFALVPQIAGRLPKRAAPPANS
jgi:Glycosyl transferase family 2